MKAKRGDVVDAVLEAMPPFPGRGNALESLLKKKSEKSKDTAEKKKDSDDDSDSDDDDDDDNSVSGASGSDGSDDDGKNGESESSGSDDDDMGGGGSGGGGSGGSGVGDLLDLMGDSDEGGGGGGGGASTNSSGGDVQGISTAIMPKVLDCFRKGCVRGKQLLYMDGALQIGIQQQYTGHQGKIMLFVANKSQTNSVTQLNVEIEETTFLAWAPNTSRSVKKNSTLQPGEQTKLMVQFMSMKPFVSPPELRLSYVGTNGTRYKYALRLPVVLTRFIAPAAGMNAQKYTGLWQTIPDTKQAQAVCDAGSPIASSMGPIKCLVKSGLRLGIVENVTNNQYVICGAGSFKTGSKDSNGKQLMVGCLLKLECNPSNNKYRVTVRAHHLDVAKAVKTIVINQLSGVSFLPGGPNSQDAPYDGGAHGM